MPDSIVLLSVCTLTVKEWEPGTVSAWSHSNLHVLLWGLSLPLLLGFRASHTPTAVACSHSVTNSYRQLHPHSRILFPFSRLIILVGTADLGLASVYTSCISNTTDTCITVVLNYRFDFCSINQLQVKG